MNEALMLNKIEGKKEKNLLDNMRKKEIGEEAFYQEQIDTLGKDIEAGLISPKEAQKQATELAPYMKEAYKPWQKAVVSDMVGRLIGGGLGSLTGNPVGVYAGSIAGGAIGSGLHGFFNTEGDTKHKLTNAGIDASLSALPFHKLFPMLGNVVKKGKEIFTGSAETLTKKQLFEIAKKSAEDKASKGLLNKKLDEIPISWKKSKKLSNKIVSDLKKYNSNLFTSPKYNAETSIPAIKKGISEAKTVGGLNAFVNKILPNEDVISKEFFSTAKRGINEFTAKSLAGSPQEQKIFLSLINPEHAGDYIQSIYKKDLLQQYLFDSMKNTIGAVQVGGLNALDNRHFNSLDLNASEDKKNNSQ